MDKQITLILASGLVVTLALYFVSIYLAGIAIIILAAIVMSLMIMKETSFHPLVTARLRADARAVVLTNTGNSPASAIHVALVPLDMEYSVETLDVDTSHEYALPSMIPEVKAVITFRNEKGEAFSSTHKLSATEEYEPLKPMIPVFGWK